MSQGSAAKMARAVPEVAPDPLELTSGVENSAPAAAVNSTHAFFRVCWYCANGLFVLSVLLALYSAIWEYSTRRYLKGFSDAIVPESSSAQEKVEAIMNWISHGPARQETDPPPPGPDRNPTDTLNYASLLRVCGTATNAFVNLADSAGVPARRLLLLDSRRMTKHVVAEVLVDGRWIVVDPAFRTIFTAADGRLLTRQDLADPTVFAAATQEIRNYDPSYTFDQTAHVRISRLWLIGRPLRRFLNRLLPGWDDSAALSLLLERESLAILLLSLLLLPILGLTRMLLRRHSENRLGMQHVRFRQQIRRALQALVDVSG